MARLIDPEESDVDHEFNAQLPKAEVPGLSSPYASDEWYVARERVRKHLEPRQNPDKDADMAAYVEGWRDALVALWETLQRAGRPRRRAQPAKVVEVVDVPPAFKEALGSAE